MEARTAATTAAVRTCKRGQFAGKQEKRPLPPVARRSSCVQLRDWWAEFHERWNSLSAPPRRSTWPSMALPNPLLVQLLQVMLRLPGNALPSAVDPVRMSCQFGLKPKPAIIAPRSVSEVDAPSRTLPLCRSSTFCATTSPLKFCHGPLPMRSRALTGTLGGTELVLRYARHVLLPAPTAVASCWQWRSAPSSPPRSPPLPEPTLATKNVMLGGAWTWAFAVPTNPQATSAADANNEIRVVFAIKFLPDTFLAGATSFCRCDTSASERNAGTV